MKTSQARVIFIIGPSGVGKTSLAASLARRMHYHQLSLDAIREKCGGDTRTAWLKIWDAVRRRRKIVVDATGASRIFRLIYRAAVFHHCHPLIVSLHAKEVTLRGRQQMPKRFAHVLLQPGKQITERYLNEGRRATHADIEIDSTHLSKIQVLRRVIAA